MDQWPDLFILQTRWEKVNHWGSRCFSESFNLLPSQDANRKALGNSVLCFASVSIGGLYICDTLAFLLLVPSTLTPNMQLCKGCSLSEMPFTHAHTQPLTTELTPPLPSDIHSIRTSHYPLDQHRLCVLLHLISSSYHCTWNIVNTQ